MYYRETTAIGIYFKDAAESARTPSRSRAIKCSIRPYRRSAQRVYSLFLLKSVQYGIIRSRGRQCKNGSDTVAPAKRTDAVQSAIARLHQAANWRLSVISACTETVRHSVAAAICVDLEH